MEPDEWDDIGGESPEYADDAVSMIREAAGGVSMIPKSLRGLDAESRELVTELLRSSEQVHQLQTHVGQVVTELRSAGISWAAIGWATGMSGEGARTRWGAAA